MAVPVVVASDPLQTGTESRLYVQAIGAAGATIVWKENMRVPINSELTLVPTGQIQSIPVFGEIFDRAIKTGRGGTLNLMSLGGATDPIVKILLDAGDAVGPTARVRVLLVNPDKRAYVGIMVVEASAPKYDNRNVFGYGFNGVMDGEYFPFQLALNDISTAP